ncbi:MAG: hypothetical protein M1142_03255 [Patescibacteria group bacterium]|nr:hypothetical protein [Patescibacteria group bacterium]
MPDKINLDKEFELYFDGQLSQINVNTLINSLLNVSTIIQQTNQYLGPEKNVEIKINPFAPGSFRILGEIVEKASQYQSLLPDGVDYFEKLIAIVVGVFTIRKFLGGEPPEKVEPGETTTSITNINGDVLVFDNSIVQIYNTNQVVNDSLSKNFETLENDPEIGTFEIKQRSQTLFKADRSDFGNMMKKNVVETEGRRAIIREKASLNIFKLVFQEDNKWGFLYDGNKIAASISDENFFKLIDEGERFAKGDTLLVDLKINQIYDPSVNGYLNESFEIVKVLQHIPRPEQQKFDLDSN